MSPAGSHMRVVPEGLRISTRVVKSNVRQLDEAAASARRRVAPGIANPADITPAELRKSRRFIVAASPPTWVLPCYNPYTRYTPLLALCKFGSCAEILPAGECYYYDSYRLIDVYLRYVDGLLD
jgi:hypothetical protein